MGYLDKDGLTYLWGKIKSIVPTKVSDLTNDSGFSTVATKTVSLSSWTLSSGKYTKTVSVSGVTASNTVIVSPAPASADVWSQNGVYCTAQANGTLTFQSNANVSVTGNVVILG